MSTIRVHPPALGPRAASASKVHGGRLYTPAAGTPLDVPDFDAQVLVANGWFQIAGPNTFSGTTAQRPAAPAIGQLFCDTTVGAHVFWDGKNWRHSVTSAIV